MDLKEITERNYKATKRRGLITEKTKTADFLNKIHEEILEYAMEFNEDNHNGMSVELADITIVCLCMAKHYNIDIQKALEEKTLYNENRKD